MEHPAARLIMVMGLPGSGKTWFAAALAKHLGAAHFNSDRIRKMVAQQVRYTDADKARVYKDLLARVTEALEQGATVIVDATFSKAAYRAPYLQWADARKVPVHLLYMEAAEPVIAERVGKKRPDSDADFAVYRKIKAEYEPIDRPHKVLRSDEGSTAGRIGEALKYMEAQQPQR
ncbi:MAG: ATP-binding protein [Flavobacteriales bacterium]|jgi:predicted kinase|nr:ATP-binding protein [Flavobacteriales bacterium]